MNKKDLNELYWFAEDLLAYTDLTGSEFDTEKAQTKLWKMQPYLVQADFPKIQSLHRQLLEELENPMFFNKVIFLEKVNELYAILAKMNGKS